MLKSEWKNGKSRSLDLYLDWEKEESGFEVRIHKPGFYDNHFYPTFAEALAAYRGYDNEFADQDEIGSE